MHIAQNYNYLIVTLSLYRFSVLKCEVTRRVTGAWFYNFCHLSRDIFAGPGLKVPRSNFFNLSQRMPKSIFQSQKKFDFRPKIMYNIVVRKIKQETPSVPYLNTGRTYITHYGPKKPPKPRLFAPNKYRAQRFPRTIPPTAIVC